MPKRLVAKEDVFAVMREDELLLHHPFESFAPVIDFLRQAASDPDVLAIKQTLYRTGPQSPVVDALVDAARSGKEVTVIEHLDLAPIEREKWLKALKASLGCGGVIEGDNLVLQGDHRKRLPKILAERGVKKVSTSN